MPKHKQDKDHNDQYLKEKIQAALLREMPDAARDFVIEVSDGVVSLTGMVDVLAERLAAEKIVQQIYGVQHVENGLTVAMDNFLPDKDINELVLEKLASASNEDVRKLGAETRDGVVFLQGQAFTLSVVREAERLAAGARGVKEVRSQIKLGDGREIDDATITNAVETAFVRSGLVNSRKVTTSTENGVIKLQGMVDTLEDIELAVEVAYRVRGVKAVHSELEVRHGAKEGDRFLTNRLRESLSREGDLSLGTVKVHVVNGMAFLSGEVFSVDDKDRIEEITRQISGITGISNNIQVSAHNLS